MAASIGNIGLGTTYGIGDGATTETFTTLAQVVKISGPNGSGDSVDITNLDSALGKREKIPGLWDEGKVSIDLIYKKANYAVLQGLKRTTKNFKIAYADTGSSIDTFTAFLTALGKETPHDDKMTCTAEFELTGHAATS